MTTPRSGVPDSSSPAPPPGGPVPGGSRGPSQPSLVPGVVLLGIAAVLIIVVLVKPTMPVWLKATIAIVAVLVVLALLVYAYRVFRGATRGGGSR